MLIWNICYSYSVTKPFEFTVDGDATNTNTSSYTWTMDMKASPGSHGQSFTGVSNANSLPTTHSVLQRSYHGGSASTTATIQAPILTQQGADKTTTFKGDLTFNVNAVNPYWTHN